MGEPVKDYRIPTEEQWDAFEERMKKKREEEEAAEKKQSEGKKAKLSQDYLDRRKVSPSPHYAAQAGIRQAMTPRQKRDAALQAMVRGR